MVAELKQGDQRRRDREAQVQEQHELVSPSGGWPRLERRLCSSSALGPCGQWGWGGQPQSRGVMGGLRARSLGPPWRLGPVPHTQDKVPPQPSLVPLWAGAALGAGPRGGAGYPSHVTYEEAGLGGATTCPQCWLSGSLNCPSSGPLGRGTSPSFPGFAAEAGALPHRALLAAPAFSPAQLHFPRCGRRWPPGRELALGAGRVPALLSPLPHSDRRGQPGLGGLPSRRSGDSGYPSRASAGRLLSPISSLQTGSCLRLQGGQNRTTGECRAPGAGVGVAEGPGSLSTSCLLAGRRSRNSKN